MPNGTTQLMSDVIDSDGFRANVGIVLMRGAGDAFLGRQVGGRGWQFPQGGVLAGEKLEQAAYRELYEEIGLSPSDVELIGQTTRWLRYRLPAKYVRRNRHPMCIGQKQRWFLLRLKREEAQFDFGRTSEPEFDQYRWVNFWEPACLGKPPRANFVVQLEEAIGEWRRRHAGGPLQGVWTDLFDPADPA